MPKIFVRRVSPRAFFHVENVDRYEEGRTHEVYISTEKSISDPSNSFNCNITSIFDLGIFLLLGFDCYLALRLCGNNIFLVDLLERPDDGQGAGKREQGRSCEFFAFHF